MRNHPWHGEVSLEADSRFPDCSNDFLDRFRLPIADLAQIVHVEVNWHPGVLEHSLR